MSNTAMKKLGIIIGVQNVVFAKLATDVANSTTYETDIFSAPGVIEIALTAQVTNESIGADDVPSYDVVTGLDSVDVSLTLASLGADGRAYLLGGALDDNGVLMEGSDDQAPFVAMGYKTPRSDGSIDYTWLYKGKFAHSDETFRTKEKGKVNWQTPTLKGSFVPRESDHLLRAIVNDGDTAAAAAIASFFDAPYVKVISD